jgi:hypothetical protein
MARKRHTVEQIIPKLRETGEPQGGLHALSENQSSRAYALAKNANVGI